MKEAHVIDTWQEALGLAVVGVIVLLLVGWIFYNTVHEKHDGTDDDDDDDLHLHQ